MLRLKTFLPIVFGSTLLLAGLAAEAADPAADFKAQMSLAMKGDMEAQYRVGEMYENGTGTPRDNALAYLWYRKAAQQGQKSAQAKVDTLEKNTTTADETNRTESVRRALRQQEEAAAEARAREKERAANEARRQEASRNTAPRPAPEPAPAPKAAEPAPAPTPAAAAPAAAEDGFTNNPCKGPSAKFLSTCN